MFPLRPSHTAFFTRMHQTLMAQVTLKGNNKGPRRHHSCGYHSPQSAKMRNIFAAKEEKQSLPQ